VGLKELSHFHIGIGAFQHFSEVRVHSQLCQVFLDDGGGNPKTEYYLGCALGGFAPGHCFHGSELGEPWSIFLGLVQDGCHKGWLSLVVCATKHGFGIMCLNCL